jgi:hypothetical protein
MTCSTASGGWENYHTADEHIKKTPFSENICKYGKFGFLQEKS